jgi:uncharacterized protein YcfJ
MRTLAKLVILGLTVTAVTPALAGRKHEHHARGNYYDYAKVVQVVPVYRSVEVAVPHESCWQEQERRPVRYRVNNDSAEKMLVGGLIGGVIGHHLGQGGDRDVATLAGTLIGAAVGREQGTSYVQGNEYYVTERERCRTYTDYRTEQQLDGYQVTYRYHGELLSTYMDHRPGDRIRISVHVAPER